MVGTKKTKKDDLKKCLKPLSEYVTDHVMRPNYNYGIYNVTDLNIMGRILR